MENRADAESPTGRAAPPKHLWVVGTLALAWNAVGAFDYLATQLELEFYMSQFSEAQLAHFYGFPSWAVAGWAVAVWAGVAGSVGLLRRRRWAVGAFVLSLAGMVVSTIYTYGMSDGAAVMGTGGVVIGVAIAAVAVFLVIYSRRQAARDVLA